MKVKTKITESVISNFEYSEKSPSCLVWRVDRFIKSKLMHKAGTYITSISKNGYYRVGVNRKQYLVHRLIFLLHFPDFDQDLTIDHIDGDRSNNIISNLRAVTASTNLRNIKKRCDNTSGVTGVSFNKNRNRWRVVWTDSNNLRKYKNFPISKFNSKDEALQAAIKFRTEILVKLNENGAGYTDRHGV